MLCQIGEYDDINVFCIKVVLMKHYLYKYKKQYYLQLFVVFNFVPGNILFRKTVNKNGKKTLYYRKGCWGFNRIMTI